MTTQPTTPTQAVVAVAEEEEEEETIDDKIVRVGREIDAVIRTGEAAELQRLYDERSMLVEQLAQRRRADARVKELEAATADLEVVENGIARYVDSDWGVEPDGRKRHARILKEGESERARLASRISWLNAIVKATDAAIHYANTETLKPIGVYRLHRAALSTELDAVNWDLTPPVSDAERRAVYSRRKDRQDAEDLRESMDDIITHLTNVAKLKTLRAKIKDIDRLRRYYRLNSDHYSAHLLKSKLGALDAARVVHVRMLDELRPYMDQEDYDEGDSDSDGDSDDDDEEEEDDATEERARVARAKAALEKAVGSRVTEDMTPRRRKQIRAKGKLDFGKLVEVVKQSDEEEVRQAQTEFLFG